MHHQDKSVWWPFADWNTKTTQCSDQIADWANKPVQSSDNTADWTTNTTQCRGQTADWTSKTTQFRNQTDDWTTKTTQCRGQTADWTSNTTQCRNQTADWTTKTTQCSWMDQREFPSTFPAEAEISHFLTSSRRVAGTTQHSIAWIPEILFPESRGAVYLRPSSSDIKNVWRYTVTPYFLCSVLFTSIERKYSICHKNYILIRINLDGQPSRYAENPDNWIFCFENWLNWQFEVRLLLFTVGSWV